MKKIKIIFLKELKDMLRDRRSIFFMIVFPMVIFPLLITGIPSFFHKAEQKERTKQLKVTVVGAEFAADLYQFMQTKEDLTVTNEADTTGLTGKIKDETIDVVVEIPETFSQDIESMTPAKLSVIFRSAEDMNWLRRRMQGVFHEYDQMVIGQRLDRFEIRQAVLSPLDVSYQNLAPMRERVGKLAGGFLPYFFVLSCFMGAMMPAIDLGAGEKERGTLETLLASPANRMEILLGKFSLVTLSGLTSAAFGILGIFIAVTQLPMTGGSSKVMGVIFDIVQPQTVFLVFSLIIPIAVLFSAVLMSLSIYAKTFKEAQSIIGPLNIVFIVPVILGLIPGIELNYLTAMVPILNISLVTKDVIAGTVNGWLLAEVYVVMFTIAAASMLFARRWFNNENVIFRT